MDAVRWWNTLIDLQALVTAIVDALGWWNFLIGLGGLITAIVAVITLIAESKRHRFSMGVELAVKLDEQFRTPRLYAARRAAASAFRSGDFSAAPGEIDEILDFFEGVAFFVEQGAIDAKTVWMFFFYYMFRMWQFVADYVCQQRRGDPTLWESLLRVYPRLMNLERKHRLRLHASADLDPEDLAAFLQHEEALSRTPQG